MDWGGANGWNHLLAGGVAALAVPAGVFGLGLPFLVVVPVALGLYFGTAFLLAPSRAIDRISAEQIGRAQAELVAGLIEEGETLVERLRQASSSLASKEAARRAAHMAEIARSILDRLAQEPGKLPAIRRFLTYYLPRSADIAEGMAVVERQRSGDPKRLAELGEMMGKLDHAFTYYSDSFAQAQLDILDVELKLLGRSLAEDIDSPKGLASLPQKGNS